MFNKALLLATKAHAGQVDKAGKPYLLHPIAVADMLKAEEEKIVALLHDVVEDTSLTLIDLRNEGFPDRIVEAVDAITKSSGISYEEYLQRVKQNPLALAVKIADMTHNMDLSRIANPTQKDYARVEKYKKLIKELKMAKG